MSGIEGCSSHVGLKDSRCVNFGWPGVQTTDKNVHLQWDTTLYYFFFKAEINFPVLSVPCHKTIPDTHSTRHTHPSFQQEGKKSHHRPLIWNIHDWSKKEFPDANWLRCLVDNRLFSSLVLLLFSHTSLDLSLLQYIFPKMVDSACLVGSIAFANNVRRGSGTLMSQLSGTLR